MNEDTPQALPTNKSGEQQVAGPAPSAMTSAAATGAPSAYPEAPPTAEIVILPSNHRPLRVAARQIFRLLAPWKILFVHAATIVELVFEPLKKVYELKPISSLEFCSRIEVLGQLHKDVVVKDEVVLRRSICADANAKLLLATPEAKQLLYPISLVVESPIIVEEYGKEFVLPAGYHPQRGGIVVTKGDKPPIVNPKTAKESLLSILEDFDFETKDDLARAVACLLTPGLLWGNLLGEIDVPVFVIEANDLVHGARCEIGNVAGQAPLDAIQQLDVVIATRFHVLYHFDRCRKWCS